MSSTFASALLVFGLLLGAGCEPAVRIDAGSDAPPLVEEALIRARIEGYHTQQMRL